MVIDLTGPVKVPPEANIELGIRPEFVHVGRKGKPATIEKVEDIGRMKIVRARIGDSTIAAIVGEGQEIPSDPKISFDPKGINIYAGSWRVEGSARP
jgi:glycerol transport system ATP-binding protein